MTLLAEVARSTPSSPLLCAHASHDVSACFAACSPLSPFRSLASNAGAQVKALKFRAVIDSPGHVIPNGIVLVDGDKISAVVTSSDRVPANAQVIDLTRYTAIPGLIDVHTHMTYYWDSTSGTDPWRQPQRTPAQTIELARANLRRTLETGVTTVRDLGSSNYMDIAMRDSINKAGWIGPRMFVAGYGLSRARPPYRPNTDTTRTAARARLLHRSDPRSGEAAGRRRRGLHQDVRIDGHAAPTSPGTRRSRTRK